MSMKSNMVMQLNWKEGRSETSGKILWFLIYAIFSVDSHEGLHLLSCIIEKLRLIGWLLHSAIDLGAKLVNEEESNAYSADGPLILFVREKLSDSAAQNDIHGVV